MGFSLGPLMARDFSTVLQTLNGFHKNLNFTVYTFEGKKSTYFISFNIQKYYRYILNW